MMYNGIKTPMCYHGSCNFMLFQFIGGLITLFAMKVYEISDALIGIFSSVGFVISNLVFAFAVSGWFMYFGEYKKLNFHELLLTYDEIF